MEEELASYRCIFEETEEWKVKGMTEKFMRKDIKIVTCWSLFDLCYCRMCIAPTCVPSALHIHILPCFFFLPSFEKLTWS